MRSPLTTLRFTPISANYGTAPVLLTVEVDKEAQTVYLTLDMPRLESMAVDALRDLARLMATASSFEMRAVEIAMSPMQDA